MEKYNKKNEYLIKKINKYGQIIIIRRSLKIQKNLLQCNKYCVITIPIYPVPKYLSRIKFYTSWCKKAIYIQILLSNRLFQFCHD